MFQSILSVLKEFVLLITYPKWLRLTGNEYVIDLRIKRVEPYRSQNFILKHQNYEFCKIPRNSSNLSQRCSYSELLRYLNDSESSELLSVFRITQRIQKAQNYSAYSELLSVFRITPRIQNYSAYSLFTRASRKASPERLTFRPPVGRPQCVSRTNTLNTRSPERGALGAESVLCKHPEKKSNSQKRLKHT